MVEQVSSGKYPGLVWEDEAKTMFRIPWKHAGKHDFRSDEDAAIFKAWAEYKGKMTAGSRKDPATWKTRLRCALNKSPEFKEVAACSQVDISEPYKVYRLVPTSEQGSDAISNGLEPQSQRVGKCKRRTKRRSTKSTEDDTEDEALAAKQIKDENVTAPLVRTGEVMERGKKGREGEHKRVGDFLVRADFTVQTEEAGQQMIFTPRHGKDCFNVVVSYMGQEVLSREVHDMDVRIAYHTPSPLPPTPASLLGGFPRISLPEPPADLPAATQLRELLHWIEKGVVLTSNNTGVYVRRYCQGRVFWVGPHSTSCLDLGPHKIQRNSDPVLVFSKEVFRRHLAVYKESGGDPPQCHVNLCFGEELSSKDDPSQKLILAKITFPWAEKEVQNANSILTLQSLASQYPNGEITLSFFADG
ncbi:hypothetical protein CRUP_028798 [Coryphaenoides rupestris]|nr:hypothetical protein CRUP_028798 [Coryphaenoides rupestris]